MSVSPAVGDPTADGSWPATFPRSSMSSPLAASSRSA